MFPYTTTPVLCDANVNYFIGMDKEIDPVLHLNSFSSIRSAIVFIARPSFFARLRRLSKMLDFSLKLNGSRLSSDSGRPTAFFFAMSQSKYNNTYIVKRNRK
jgi:hypothetical protein